MRAIHFVEKLQDVVPPLMSVTELDAEVIREHRVKVYGVSVLNSRRRGRMSTSFTSGAPEAPGSFMSDVEQLGGFEEQSASFVLRSQRESIRRSSLESSLAAMVRIADVDFTDLDWRTKRLIGNKTLWLTRQAIGLSLTTGPANCAYGRRFFDEIEPEVKIPSRSDSYTELLPYMTHKQREFIEPKLENVASKSAS